MTQASDWQGKVGENWAREHARTDRSLAQVNVGLLERAERVAPEAAAILDIGCGAGATGVALAGRYPSARVLGIDLSGALVASALARPDLPGNVRFEQADAGAWQDGGFLPDLLVSRHGVMFFDDPVAAFTSLRGAAAPGAHLVFSCFRDRALNGWISELSVLLPPSPAVPATAPGPFAFADEVYVTGILRASGWGEVRAEPLDFDYVAGGGNDPVADAVEFFTRIGPAAPVIATLDEPERSVLLEKLQVLAEHHRIDDQVIFPAAAWVWSARA